MTRWSWVLLLLAAAGASCSLRQNSGSDHSSEADDGDWLQVSASPHDIDLAKKLSAEQAADNIQALEHPEQIWFVDRQTEELLAQHRHTVIPKLLTVLESAPNNFQQRLRAASLLVRLGDVRGCESLATALRSSDSQQLIAAIHEINSLHSHDDDSQPAVRLLLDQPGMSELMLAQLDHPDPQVQKAAIQANGLLNIPAHVARLQTLIHQNSYPDRGRIAFWLASNGDPAVVIDDIAAFFQQGMTDEDVYNTVSALNKLAEKGDQSVRARIMQLIRQYYQRSDLDHAKLASSVGWQFAAIIANYAGPESADWLKARLPALSPGQRGGVYRALARIEAEGWRPLLLAALRHPDTRIDAAQALGEKLQGAQDKQVVDALVASLADADSEAAVTAVCKALLNVDGDTARAAVKKSIDRVDPWSRMDLTWRLRGITLAAVQPQLAAAGLLTEEEFQSALDQLQPQERQGDSDSLIAVLLQADRLLWFDVETGELPCRHDRLLLDFARISGGVFQPLHVSETWSQSDEDDFEADYTLRFVSAGRCYQAQLQNLGDWYDLQRLVAVANQAVADSGRPQRFTPLFTGGQDANFIFGDPAKLQQLAAAIALPIDDDPSRALNEGKEFEERVLQQLREQGQVVE